MRIPFVARATALLALVAAPVLGCSSLPDSAVAVLEGADSFQVLALDPDRGEEPPPGVETFHGHQVLAKGDVEGPEARERIAGIVNAGVRKGGTQAKCFNPRHGVHAVQGGRTVDLVICYECSALEVVEDGRSTTLPTGDVQADLDEAFRAAGVIRPTDR
ncbi:hypothetical protein [Polyangium jinanense]|uniref:Lipoprotein n=1 Tax=Polyangium jinanense TaxID=2829994 RepID=A0A9X3XCD0_9BACT|nr:hypothetical protein [Polyangium jinanense]MDC3960559.1 hypothetical protein [Polyangium jinanense]MDC3985421.1 hypothetical protein [Polyangium jinanense]